MRTFANTDLVLIIRSISARLRSESDYLCRLDGEIGDGDHGTTMALGFAAMVRAVGDRENRQASLSHLLELCADAFLNEVGATMGPLYTSAFLKAAAYLGDETEIPLADAVMLLPAMCDGFTERGKAGVGDKTMMDVWVPVSYSIRSRYKQNLPVEQLLDDIASTAKHAAISTKTMIASKGRAARLGERSLGHIDPGAASAAMIIEIFCESILAMVHDAKK